MQQPAAIPADPYFRSLGDGRYAPTAHTEGAWARDEQHMAPIGGLLVQELLDHESRTDLQLARVSFDILGKIPLAEFTIEVRTLRPGRTIELVQAEASAGGRAFLRATGWRLVASDTSAVAGGAPPPPPTPDLLPSTPLATDWGGGYIDSLRVRPVRPPEPGHGEVWLGTDVALRDRGPVSDLARLAGLIDTANGVAPRRDPREWLYPNTDLTVHLYRQPIGGWLGLVVDVVWGETGVGLTSTTLFDERGAWGRAEQILTLRALRA
ncbi:thioesterase family protein [Naumannella huperziae]